MKKKEAAKNTAEITSAASWRQKNDDDDDEEGDKDEIWKCKMKSKAQVNVSRDGFAR